MRKKKTHEQYVAEVAIVNPDIEVVGEYVNNGTKILHRCKIDGHEWYVKPNHILQRHGCPMCGKVSMANKKRKMHKQYVEEVAKINSNIEVVDEYIDDNTKILHRCKIDGYEWMAKPNNILNGKGCPRCVKCERYGHEEYVKRVSNINQDIEVVGTYVNDATKILHRCKVDCCEWYATPNNILHGSGCPKCNTSKGEKAVSNWLEEKNILYESQKIFNNCKDKHVLPFDFYLPDYNVAIEYQGKQHYEPIEYFGGQDGFEYVIRHDRIKKDYCKKNNIPLIAIPYYTDVYEELAKMFELYIAKEVTVA